MNQTKQNSFETYLPIWIILCLLLGILLSKYWPGLNEWLEKAQVTKLKLSLPLVILIGLMIFSMALNVDVKKVGVLIKQPAGLYLSTSMNFIIKPFTLYLLSSVFFYLVVKRWMEPELASKYLLGMILLGTSSCTSLIHLWTKKMQGDETFTLALVLFNAVVMLLVFPPLTKIFILFNNRVFVDQQFNGIGRIQAPLMDLYISLGLYILLPVLLAIGLRLLLTKWMGADNFNQKLLSGMKKMSLLSFLLTLIVIFTIQGKDILNHPIDLILLAIPMIFTYFIVFFLSFLSVKSKLPFSIGGPTVFISTSHFFEFALASSLMIGGMKSRTLIVPILALFIEVPLLRVLVRILNRWKTKFKPEDQHQ